MRKSLKQKKHDRMHVVTDTENEAPINETLKTGLLDGNKKQKKT